MSFPSHSSAAFFEAKYQRDTDPWDFERSAYERGRYDAILQAVGDSRYGAALEPGCSVGILTEALAPLCDHLLAFDFSPTAARTAELRCRRFPHVQVCCLSLEDVDSFAEFDLVVLSEIGYYFTGPKWKQLVAKIVAEMRRRSTLLAVHWTGHSADHEISGELVHEVLRSNRSLILRRNISHVGFMLERWQRL